ncbi:MAG: porin [Acidobacteria bacterium]|nr:porin [Acidobacteriota bacterium]
MKFHNLTNLFFIVALFIFIGLGPAAARAQQTGVGVPADESALLKTPPNPVKKEDEMSERERLLTERIEKLEKRLQELESRTPTGDSVKPEAPATVSAAASTPAATAVNASQTEKFELSKEDRGVLDFFRDTTINFGIDGYYAYNFNRPYNRFNPLRAYDASADSFSLGQASVVVENAPNVEKGRRFGFRLDLQFGQATQTVQGNPANELRPEIYRPVWQAYGTYVAPVGKGLTLDFGKWAGALGYETNYAKDNFNYSRSYFFNYLPYYHTGLRASYPLTDKLTAVYWLVNGAQQSEDFNNSKSQAILLTYKPTNKIILQGNYYVGQEQRDQQPVDETTPAVFDTTRGRITPKGKFHVFDAYGTFLLSDKTTLALEGDYVVNRVNRRDAPARVAGGAVYLRHQFTPKFAVAGRAEYLSDRGGLFSGTTQALKELTVTGEYKFAEGFLLRAEYRRDWSNRPFFTTNDLNVLKKEQNTATLGFIWWVGRKDGAW